MGDQQALDLEAIDAVLRGRGEAYGALVGRYQAMVAGIAWRHGFRRQDVEDIVSEVFLKTYRNLDRYRPDHAFSTWLYRLAANHVIDRTRRARKEAGRTELPEGVADPAPGPGEGVERRERAALLRRALGEISPRYREAIQLVYVEGCTVEETARVLGVPGGTVKTRLMRGRRALREILAGRHPEIFGSDDEM